MKKEVLQRGSDHYVKCYIQIVCKDKNWESTTELSSLKSPVTLTTVFLEGWGQNPNENSF